jgi:hypothetical protein
LIVEAIGLKFGFSGDKTVANATAAMAMRGLDQMYDVYQTSRSEILRCWVDFSQSKLGSVLRIRRSSQRVLGNDGLQLFLRALNAQTSGRARRQVPLSLVEVH